jgi:hypothetical protein
LDKKVWRQHVWPVKKKGHMENATPRPVTMNALRYGAASRAKSVLSALGFSGCRKGSKAPQTHAKTSAENNVPIVDKGYKFPHYTEDTID